MKKRMQGLVMEFQKRLIRRQVSYDMDVDQPEANYYETMKSYLNTQNISKKKWILSTSIT